MRLFARARDVAGADSIRVTLPSGATVARLRQALCEACPGLTSLAGGLLVAVNAQYASDALSLSADAEVACFPPVSGG